MSYYPETSGGGGKSLGHKIIKWLCRLIKMGEDNNLTGHLKDSSIV